MTNPNTTSTGTIGVGMVGYGFMGRAHSQALRNVASVFDLPLAPRMVSLCGRDEAQVSASAQRLGWDGYDTDWRELIARDDIDLVIVGTPGHTHAEIAIAALDAGKHVLCEKPLANTVADARLMVEAAARAEQRGVRSMVAHNYRRVPALEMARGLIADGRLGEIRQVRGMYLQDWLVDPEAPLVWRLQSELAGSGALGDIGSHVIDIAQHVLGDRLVDISAITGTMVDERPLPDGSGRGAVTVDDVALVIGHFAGGALASFEATRMATGMKNALRLEVHGSTGAFAFDLERLDELQVLDNTAEGPSGFRRVLVTNADDPWMRAWWPPGHIIGWEHTFVHQLHDLLADIAAERSPHPSFAEGLALQQVLDAVLQSAESGQRQPIPH